MVDLLLQIALDDTAAVLAVVVMIYAAGSGLFNAYYTHRWWDKTYRRFIYAGTFAVRVATAVAYGAVLFVNPGASVALLRPLFLLTMILCDIVTIRLDTLDSHDPGELARQRIKQLEYEVKDRMQDNENARGTNQILIEQIREMKAENEQLTKSLEAARAEMVKMLDIQMELREEVDRLRARDGR